MLPGLPFPIVDAHTTLLPDRLQRALQAHLRANLWHPRYDGSPETLVPLLTTAGIDQFLFLPYATAAGQARSVNYWTANVQATFAPQALGFATFHPEDEALPTLVDDALVHLGLRGVMLHPPAGDYAADDSRLDPVYAAVARLGRVAVLHAGRRPEPGPVDGARSLERVLRRHPDLLVIATHMGADEFDRFFDLCDGYPNLYLSTAMVFNGFLGGPPPMSRVLEFQDRVLFGSGFPNAPFRLEAAIQAIRDLQLGVALEQKLFWSNVARVLNLDGAIFTN